MNMPEPPERSYGCTFGCGNPYDYVLVDVRDGETQFICIPCFVRTATDMVRAIENPEDPEVQAAMQAAAAAAGNLVPGPGGRARGKNAPATADDPNLFAAYDGRVTVDDLDDRFK